MSQRYRAGIAYRNSGSLMSAIQDTKTGEVYPVGTPFDFVERVTEMLNGGMYCTLYPGDDLTFKTLEEATCV